MSKNSGDVGVHRDFQQIETFLERERALGSDIVAFCELLAGDSAAALQDIESPALGTSLADKWPLANKTVTSRSVAEYAKHGLSGTVYRFYPSEIASAITHQEYAEEELSGVYGDRAISGFAHDLVGWAAAISKRGWPVLAYLNVYKKITLGVHDDSGKSRKHIASLTERAGKTQYQWLSPRIVAIGSPDELRQLD